MADVMASRDAVNETTKLLAHSGNKDVSNANGVKQMHCYSGSIHSNFAPRRGSQATSITGCLGGCSNLQDPSRQTSENIYPPDKAKSPYLAGVSVRRFWLIFCVILATYFIACFDGTLMVSSHPVITSYFHSSNSASWLSTAFLVSSTGFQTLFGGLSDTLGRKPPYICSLSIFLVATVWCGLAQSMTSFIAARALCGLGAGGMITMCSIITSDLVPIEVRGVYQSYINMIFGVGSASGAALGGWIADSLGWRWEFGIQVPTLVVCLIVAMLTLPSELGLEEGVQKKSIWHAIKTFDFQGSVLLTISIIFLVLGLDLGGNVFPWAHPLIITSFIIFLISFPLLIYVESYADHPIMPLKIMLQNPRAGLIITNGIAATVLNFVIFNIPLFFQAVMLESATKSGLKLLVPSIATSITGATVGFLITWTRHLKLFLVLGAFITFIGTIELSFLQKGLPSWGYLLLLIPTSVGQGLTNPTTFMSVLVASLQSEQAIVTSMLVLWRSIGMVFGIAFSSLILQNTLVYYLNHNVTGPEKDNVIEAVRRSIAAIQDLEPRYQVQVQDSYAAALRSTFFVGAILSAMCFVYTAFLKVPRLRNGPPATV
ncbi:hypothetical protein K3495_g11643 [Podosphaera aphanis]|nr:hypothetical protein K3495_g11643 [Podosphaera aphanis]